MTEEAAVFGRMILGERGDTFRGMALTAEFFRLFLVHCHESGMVFIVGQVLGGLFGRPPEKQENTAADQDEDQIIEKQVLPFALVFFRIH